MRVILQKIFTREFPLVLVQIWGRRYKHIFSQDLKTTPRNIFVCHRGLVEAYRGARVNHDVSTILLAKIKKDKNFISDFLQKHQNKISVFKQYFHDTNFTQKKFVNFLELILDFWQAIFISLFVPSDKRFSAVDRHAAMVFRKKIANFEYEIFHHIDVFLKNLYKDRGVAARYVYLKEVVADRIPSQKVLWQRKKEKLFIVDDKILTFTQFRKLQKRFNFKLETPIISRAVEEIKGQTACTGKVRGQVQLIMRNQDVNLFKAGRVLVSTMTVPTFLPAMRKAIAFVTDEGGITCHAAIVAREMKKPCIIGTKIATKVFKDGDKVEVDAEKGVVRKLS